MLNRRKFLRNLGFTGSLLTMPAALVKAGATATDAGERRLSGHVFDGNKGLSGVAVTDGYTIVRTDKDGKYELSANPSAGFVYISVPSGYHIPEERYIASFYRSLDRSLGNDFTLEKLPIDDRKHNFVVWADTQMISKKDCEQLMNQSVPDLKGLLRSYPKDTLWHGIGCGDLVWDHFDLYGDYKEAVYFSGIPFYNVIGNHDMDLDARTDDRSDKTFRENFGPTWYSFNRGEIHYVVLDDVFFIGADKKYIGYLTESQLAWLEQDLAMVKHGSTVVVSLHIPTNTGAARRDKKEEELGGTVSNRKQLYKLLAHYKVHLMSGHTHYNDNWEEGDMMEHNHGTVCGAWWTGPICGDGTPSGYGVYEVDGADIKWYYKSTGMDRSKQMRIRAVEGEIVANVWNWDNKWKVEWFEDGVSKGPMEQRVAFDPWAVELYAGPELPKKHTFVEPFLTDHIFFAKASAGAKKIMVRVTDRFGNIYEETV